MHEAIRDYNEIESHNMELNDFGVIDISSNEQELNNIKAEFSANVDLSDIRKKKQTFPSAFKTALEIRNEEELLQATKSDTIEKVQFKDFSAKDIKIDETENKTLFTTNYNSVQRELDGFVCARQIHETDSRLPSSNKMSSKSKHGTSYSTSKSRRSKTEKTARKAGKTVYEQILASARSPLKKTRMSSNSDISVTKLTLVDESNSKTENKANRRSEFSKCAEESNMEISLETESKAVCLIKDVDGTRDKYKNKRSCEYSDKICRKSVERKGTTEHDKTRTCEPGKSIIKTSFNNKIHMEDVRNDRDTNVKQKESLMLEKDRIKHSSKIKSNLVSEEKRGLVSSSHSKSHGKSKSGNRIKVPADRATQFKTAEILKSYLMKYYPSERIPDRATFSKTCREMHYNMLKKKIFGKIF